MSLNDGKVTNNTLYLTSDIALASYLATRGFILLGAYDKGGPRKEFGLTHTDQEVLDNLEKTVARLADEFDNLHLQIPHEPESRVNFRMYWRNIKNCHHALDDPIKGDDL